MECHPDGVSPGRIREAGIITVAAALDTCVRGAQLQNFDEDKDDRGLQRMLPGPGADIIAEHQCNNGDKENKACDAKLELTLKKCTRVLNTGGA